MSSIDGTALRVGDVCGLRPPTSASEQMVPFLSITINAAHVPSNDPLERVVLDFIAHTPREEIGYLWTCGRPAAMESVYPLLPNLRTLRSERTRLALVFPGPSSDGQYRFPPQGLRYVFLGPRLVTGGDWTPLTGFLSSSFHTSSINRFDLLEVIGPVNMRPEVEEDIRGSVREFSLVTPS
jgi:hypothetical protein